MNNSYVLFFSLDLGLGGGVGGFLKFGSGAVSLVRIGTFIPK